MLFSAGMTVCRGSDGFSMFARVSVCFRASRVFVWDF